MEYKQILQWKWSTVLLLLSSWTSEVSTVVPCVEQLPAFRDGGKNPPRLPVGIQVLVPSFEFTCRGVVQQWGLVTEKMGQHRIDMQVWRPDNTIQDAYDLVGSNRFNNVQPNPGDKLLYLEPLREDWIQFEPGDIVGMYIDDNPVISDDYVIQTQINYTGVMVKYTTVPAPLERIQPDTLKVALPDTAPVISMQMELATGPQASTMTLVAPQPTGAPTPDSNGGDDGGLPIGAIVGALIGVLVFSLLVAGLILVVGCLMVRRGAARRRAEEVGDKADGFVTTSNSQAPSATNPNYINVSKHSRGPIIPPTGMELSQNPAYGQGTFNNNAFEYEVPLDSTPNTSSDGRKKDEFVFTESGVYEEPYAPGKRREQHQENPPENHIYEDPELLL